MKRIVMALLVCVLGACVALAQSNPNPSQQQSSSTAAQGPTSGTGSANQAGASGNAQPSANRAAPNNQPAAPGSDARTDQNAPSRSANPNGNGGGIPIAWAVVAIIVVLGVVFFIAGGGRSEMTPIDREAGDGETFEDEEIERERDDRAA